MRLNGRKCKDFCCIHNSYTFILYNIYCKPNFIHEFRKAKINRHEHVFENGIIYIKYSAIVNIAKVDSRKIVLAKELRKLISMNKSYSSLQYIKSIKCEIMCFYKFKLKCMNMLMQRCIDTPLDSVARSLISLISDKQKFKKSINIIISKLIVL